MEINKYHNSKIYKLISDHTDKIYIGSTVQPLHKRKSGHKKGYIIFKNHNKNYVSSYDLIELGEIDIILIENFKCENKEELHARERYHIELKRELCVNKHIPSRSQKEWYENNKEDIKEKRKEREEKIKDIIKEKYKERYINNKETINEKQKEKLNCECGGKFTNSNKLCHLKSKKHLNYLESFE